MNHPFHPLHEADMNEERIQNLLEAMTLEEQVSLLAGANFWMTVAIPRLGIPAIKVTDGPNGARGGGSLVGGVKAASFPVGIALAASWNLPLVHQIGQALAEEAQSKGARVLLAPTVNIHRSPVNGRNFECYSEDPFLSAQLAVAYITGVQSKGVSATAKHFVGNESEFERMTISSEIDERPLREIYLPPFEAAVKEAHTWAVMSAYNRVNGTHMGEHPILLRKILKQEWGFDGLVMSDWFATHSVSSVEAGLDLEMPGPARERGKKLLSAVRSGAVGTESVSDSVRRLLRLLARVDAFENPASPEEQAIDRPEHRALIRQTGAEGIVLLKNEGILPLDRGKLEKIAVIGPNAKTAQIMGGGSAQLNAHYRVSPFDGIFAYLGEEIELAHEVGCSNSKLLPLLPQTFSVEYFNSLDLSGEVVHRADAEESEIMWLQNVAPDVDRTEFSARLITRFTPTEDGDYYFGLASAGRSRLFVNDQLVVNNWDNWEPGDTYFGSGSVEARGMKQLEAGRTYDLKIEYASLASGSFGIRALRLGTTRPLGEDALQRAAQLAAESDVAVLYVGLNGDWDTEGHDRQHMDLVGEQNELIRRVAAANPNTVVVLQTGGPVTMPWLDEVAAVLQAWYPGQECGNSITDVLFGRVNPSGKLPQTFPLRLEDNPAFINYPGENGKVRYGEGIFVGYRYYDKKKVKVLFPFGHGLSYTSFAYDNLRLSTEQLSPDDELTVTFDVTNTGTRAGQEVAQLYVRDEKSRLARPEKELKGFAKISLQPGETKTVSLKLGMRSLAYFDDAKPAWVAEAGGFEVLIGSSSLDLRAHTSFTLNSDWVQPV
jgi:beta-glucosidase